MKKIIFFAVFILSLVPNVFADTIKLKSGQEFEGKILERTNDSVKIEFNGVQLTYFLDEIEKINGEKFSLETKNTPAPAASASAETSSSLAQVTNVVPYLLRAKISANEDAARATVRNISTAIETYGAVNGDKYPISESALVDGKDPYLSEHYNNKIISGYIYALDLNRDSYRVIAKPETCGSTGTKVITVETGGVMREEECK